LLSLAVAVDSKTLVAVAARVVFFIRQDIHFLAVLLTRSQLEQAVLKETVLQQVVQTLQLVLLLFLMAAARVVITVRLLELLEDLVEVAVVKAQEEHQQLVHQLRHHRMAQLRTETLVELV
jgi:hypothetical protein